MSLRKPLQGLSKTDFSLSESALVGVNEFGVSHAKASRPVLGSVGASTCVIIGLIDKKNNVVVLAHIAETVAMKHLDQLFSYVSKEHTVAHLTGGIEDQSGDLDSVDHCKQIVDVLEKNKIKIINCDLGRKLTETSAALALDARTGKIYVPTIDQLFPTYDVMSRLFELSVPNGSAQLELKKVHCELPKEQITFTGLKAGFLNSKEKKSEQPKTSLSTTTPDRESKLVAPKQSGMFSGLKGGFLNPVASVSPTTFGVKQGKA